MPALKGLVRSVRTPEFAGITFHEVRARSVLNRVPGASPMPFAWTVNPYRGCSHACTYCLSLDTRILMVDGTSVRLADVRVGDLVVGSEVRSNGIRSLVPTPVHAAWTTTKAAWRVRLLDGTAIVASADHRFLTRRGWVHVRPEGCAGDERPHLRVGEALVGAETLADEAFRRPGSPPVAPAPPGDEPGGRVVVGVDELPGERALGDLTTGTGDFVADGVISHNCFARNTHTYLDLDAGDDFDRQVVVKLNAPEVLARELRAPRWAREHVAMGTNTDPYQRAEGRYALMPGIIKALGASGTPFSILTKGTLLARDLPSSRPPRATCPSGSGCRWPCSTPSCTAASSRARRRPGPARPRAPHPRRRPAVRGVRRAGPARAHRLRRGARRPARRDRRGRGERRVACSPCTCGRARGSGSTPGSPATTPR